MVGQLVTLLLVAAGALVAPEAGCPSTDAVAAELERLGTAAAVAAVGAPEVRVHGPTMRVALHGLDGAVSGGREVAAPASCAERARVAAVLVSAWVGAWRSGSFPEPARPTTAKPSTSSAPPAATDFVPGRTQLGPPQAGSQGSVSKVRVAAASAPLAPAPAASSPPGAASSVARPRVATASAPEPAPASPPSPARAPDGAAARAVAARRPARGMQLELGGFGFGIHDGDAATFGAGIQVGLRFPRWFGIDAVFAGSGERERAMVRGAAAYHLYDLGLGVSLRKRLGPAFADLGVLPEVTFLAVDGRNLSSARGVTRWGAAACARVRLGLVLGPWHPYAFAGVSYALRAERLVLDDYPEQGITLSRWNFSFGLGLAYLFGAARQGETNARPPALGLVE